MGWQAGYLSSQLDEEGVSHDIAIYRTAYCNVGVSSFVVSISFAELTEGTAGSVEKRPANRSVRELLQRGIRYRYHVPKEEGRQLGM